ncbi:hypothetical protein PQX77_003415 [Marasmius sp. AFHP31]|nr:hypothetical protein PQX77_003415 [Marasmius sp. AFHP31]
MPHLELKCTGDCLQRLAQTIDLQNPAADVPHDSLRFSDEISEAIYVLTARLTPAVVIASQCKDNFAHETSIIWVANWLKIRRWDFEETTCKCPLYLFGWDSSLSQCLWNGFTTWQNLLDQHEDDMEEQQDALLEGEKAIAYFRRLEEKKGRASVPETARDSDLDEV